MCPGFSLGHFHDLDAFTGVTVVLCPAETTAACELRGTATATRGIDALRPEHLVGWPQHLTGYLDAIVFAGGSAFGLAAAGGVMQYLEERGRGLSTGRYRVPTAAAAVVFDLNFGRGDVRPDEAMGRAACEAAADREGPQGSVGAGTGATVGKLLGMKRAMKGGLGTASITLSGGGVVAALTVVNAYGGVHNAESGEILAGPRAEPPEEGFIDTSLYLRTKGRPFEGFSGTEGNTTLVAVATDVALTKTQTQKLAQMAANGLILTVRPSYTTVDGDVAFALSCGRRQANLDEAGAAAQDAVGRALRRSIVEANGFGILPAHRDLQ